MSDSEGDINSRANASGIASQANQSKLSAKGQSRARSRDVENSKTDGRRDTNLKRKDQPKYDKEKVDALQTFRAGLIFVIFFTAFADMIGLAYLMFRNIVPLTDGIQINEASSILYFVFSIITLLFLYVSGDRVNGAVREEQISALAPVLIVYFLILISIAIVILVDDVKKAAADKYPLLSQNQKSFFGNQQTLEDTRMHYTFFAGIFQIVLAVLILIIAALTFVMKGKLDELKGFKFKGTEVNSRCVCIEDHQAAYFSNIQVNGEDKLMVQLALGRHKPKGKKVTGYQDDDVDESKDGYVYDSDQEDMDYEIKIDNQQY